MSSSAYSLYDNLIFVDGARTVPALVAAFGAHDAWEDVATEVFGVLADKLQQASNDDVHLGASIGTTIHELPVTWYFRHWASY